MAATRKRGILKAVAAVIVLLSLIAIVKIYRFWYSYIREKIFYSWMVSLPDGSRVEYRNQGPEMRPVFSPADSEKMLLWTRPDGTKQEYPISGIGGRYDSLEARLREDGRAVWLIDWEHKEVVATLNLDTGVCTGEGGVLYDKQGVQSTEGYGTPGWARLNRGKCLIWSVPVLYQGYLEYRPHYSSSGLPITALVWLKEDGQRVIYPINNSGRDYGDMEIRNQDDGAGIWIIDRGKRKVIAALDLTTGSFTAEEGTIYQWNGLKDPSRLGFPQWATLQEGRVLGSRRLY